MQETVVIALVLAAPLSMGAKAPTPRPGPARAADWIAVDPGHRWEYEVTRDRTMTVPGRPEQQQTITSRYVDEILRNTNRTVRRSTHVPEREGDRPSHLEHVVLVDEQGYRLVGQTMDKGNGDPPEAATYDPPLMVLPPVPRAGDRWKPGTMKMGNLLIEVEQSEIVGIETVSTPAGTFEQCLKVAARGSVSGSMTNRGESTVVRDGSMTETSWYAPGIGEVRSEAIQAMTLVFANGVTVKARDVKTKILQSHAPGSRP